MKMNNIKFAALILALAGGISACADKEEYGKDNVGKTRPTVELEQVSVEDHSVSFKLTASDESAIFAYAVYTGEATAPTAYEIVCGEASGADGSESFDVKTGGNTQTITLDALDALTDVTVYASAISATGFLSEVKTLLISTPDTEAPELTGVDHSGSTVTLTYSEDIELGSGTATCRNIKWGTVAETDPVAISEDNITISGNVATIVCPKPGAGAGYIVSYTEGLFQDASGNKVAAVTSGYSSQAQDYVGIGWDDENEAFALKASGFEEFDLEKDYGAAGATITYVSDIDLYDNGQDRAVVILYDEVNGISREYAEYSIGEDKRSVTFVLPRAPKAFFDVEIAAGAFYDEYGNENADYSPEDLGYYHFPVNISSDVFSVNYTNPSSGEAGEPFALTVQYFDAKYVVAFANWFNIEDKGYALPYLLGTVDYDTRTITFNGLMLNPKTYEIYSGSAFGISFYYWDEEGTQIAKFLGGGYGSAPITVTFDENGDLQTISQCGWYVLDAATGKGLGYGAVLSSGTLSKVEPTDGASIRTARSIAAGNAATGSGRILGYKSLESAE